MRVAAVRMGGAPVRLKWMRLEGSTEAFTSTTAWRSEPGPLSRLFVTVTVSPCACSRHSAATSEVQKWSSRVERRNR